ncbi:MAG: hypothetical protein QOF06_1751 [Solirubrobacterales bacterium]|jgi:hypothetical protein|nr:hypothetical protein [Solirubrobacterales bacterium]
MRLEAAERDALYEQIFVRLSGIDEVWMAAETGDYAWADQVAREFSDYLRLILDDLGWGEGGGEPLELATPPDVLRRVCTQMQGRAEAQREMEEAERAESRAREERTQRLLETCRRVLGELG